MAGKTLFMETTEIPVEKTLGEITRKLIEGGANQITTQHEGGKTVGLSFVLKLDERNSLPFSLPVRVAPVFEILNGRRPANDWDRNWRGKYIERDAAQAERVAWRQLLRWVEAQLAMIDTGMVQPAEVFLPYLLQQNGQTVYETFAATKLLAAPGEGGGL